MDKKRLLTDLAIEQIGNSGIREQIFKEGRALVNLVKVEEDECLKDGIYITISFNKLYKSLTKVVGKYLNKMIKLNFFISFLF